jgi:hypothetical protein
MPEPESTLPSEAIQLTEHEEIHSEDFQFVLRHLLAAYQPVLEEELRRAGAPEELKREAEANPPSCDDELRLADRIFDKFFTEEVAVRLLPEEGRRQLGPAEGWRWCFRHIRCCIIFGWLLCRRQRTFRAFNYYLYRYWLCVRQALGTPVGSPPTAEEREDFQVLVRALASAYKPYLTDQLASVEFPSGIPDEVLSGTIDCFEGEQEVAAVLDRFLTVETAPALLGKKAFETHSKEPSFWFCRCWCLCAIRFGCCLASAKSFVDVLRCLLFYRGCLRECFQPIRCDLTAPTGCAEEKPGLAGLPTGEVGLEINGTAAGAFFDHYTLEWRLAQGQPCQDDTTCPQDGSAEPTTGWSCLGMNYPGGGATGTAQVVSGTLGALDTTFLPAGSYEIRLCIYATNNVRTCCCTQFALFKKLVFITRIAETPGAFVATPPGPFLGTSQIVNSNPAPPGVVVPVGGAISVWGAAFVGECQNRKIKCIDLRAAIGFQVGPEDPGFAATLPLYTIPLLSAPICYDDVPPADEIKKRLIRLDSPLSELTAFWKHLTTIPGQPWLLKPNPFQSDSGLPVGISAAGCPDPHHRCRSGQYTILLDVTDTLLIHYYDTQQVWFDNKTMATSVQVLFHGLEGLPSCQDLHLNSNSAFIPPGAPCNVAWPVNLLGIAYDEYIDETDLTYPSDNFDFYTLSITKQTGEVLIVPITVAPDPMNALHGLQRRGQPGVRCEPLPAGGIGCPPAEVVPGQSFDVLTALDMRVFDAVCAPNVPAPYSVPATFPLPRGTCCGYTYQLYAQDKTWSDGWAGGFHHAWSLPWAVCICNDLPAVTPPGGR